MASELRELLTYFTVDNNYKRILIIGSLMFLGMMLSSLIPVVGFIPYLYLLAILIGQFTKTINLRTAKPKSGAAEFKNINELAVIGLKVAIGYIAYTMVFLFAVCLLGIIFGIIYSAIKTTAAMVALGIIVFIIFVGLGCFYLLYLLTAYISFCFNMKLESFFDFKRIRNLEVCSRGELAKLLLSVLILYLCALPVCALLLISIIGIILVPVLGYYLYLIQAELTAKCARAIVAKK